MNIGFYSCIAMAGIFAIVTILFSILGEKAAMLVSGFNTLPKEKREQYDKKKLSRDNRNIYLFSTIIMLAGAALSYFISPYIAIAAFALWLVLLFSNVHLNPEKAFEKYKIKK